MRIFIKAKPLAHEEKVEKLPDGSFAVSVKEPPINGQANRAIARLVATYLGVSAADVRLVSGFSSRNKVFEIK